MLNMYNASNISRDTTDNQDSIAMDSLKFGAMVSPVIVLTFGDRYQASPYV